MLFAKQKCHTFLHECYMEKLHCAVSYNPCAMTPLSRKLGPANPNVGANDDKVVPTFRAARVMSFCGDVNLYGEKKCSGGGTSYFFSLAFMTMEGPVQRFIVMSCICKTVQIGP